MNVETSIVIHTRLKPQVYTLLNHISKHSGLKKSTLLRTALNEYLKNIPEELPLPLRIEITRVNIQTQINTIKNLIWTYHQARNAQFRIEQLKHQKWLPPHTTDTIQQLENQILQLQTQLDSQIKQQYTKKEAQP